MDTAVSCGKVTAVNLVAWVSLSPPFLPVPPAGPENTTGNKKVLPTWTPPRWAQEEGVMGALGTLFPRAHPEREW